MAFGLSDTGKAAVDSFLAGAPALVDKLNAAGHTLEADLLSGIHTTLSEEISEVGATLLKVEAPMVAQLELANENVATLIGMLRDGFEGDIGGMKFNLRSKQNTPPLQG